MTSWAVSRSSVSPWRISSAIVSQDSVGGNLYTEGVAKYKKD